MMIFPSRDWSALSLKRPGIGQPHNKHPARRPQTIPPARRSFAMLRRPAAFAAVLVIRFVRLPGLPIRR